MVNFFKYRIVRDHRVKAFNMKSAERFLRERNVLYKPITKEMWDVLKEQPDEDLLVAYGDYCFEQDFAK